MQFDGSMQRISTTLLRRALVSFDL